MMTVRIEEYIEFYLCLLADRPDPWLNPYDLMFLEFEENATVGAVSDEQRC